MVSIRWPFGQGGRGRAPNRGAPEEKASRAAVLLSGVGRARWTPNDYASLAREGYQKNAVAYRCIRMIAEVFRPATGGEVGPVSGGGVTVNVAVDGGAPALLRSEAQIAQMQARAVSLGARRM